MTDLVCDAAEARAEVRAELTKQARAMIVRSSVDPTLRLTAELERMIERSGWLVRMLGLLAATAGDAAERAQTAVMAAELSDARRVMQDELDRRLEVASGRMLAGCVGCRRRAGRTDPGRRR